MKAVTAASQKKVLVVEDESIVAEDIRHQLTDMGYGISGVARTGPEAIRLAEQSRPDVVVMDIRLSGEMDGTAAASKITEHCDIPVIFLTAYSDEETLRRAGRSRPYGYLLKPFDGAGLRTTIEMALARHGYDADLRRAYVRSRRALEGLGQAVITADAEGRVESLNPLAEKLLGLPVEEAAGEALEDVLSLRCEGEEALSPVRARALRSERPVELPSGTCLASGPAEGRPVSGCAAALRGDDGFGEGLVVAFSAQPAAGEMALIRRAQANRMAVDRLAGGIAHHYNNILTVVIGNAELLKTQAQEQTQLLEHISCASQRAAELTRDLMAYSARPQTFSLSIDADELLHEIAGQMRPHAPAGTQLRALHSSKAVRFWGDRRLLLRALRNLVKNAFEALGEGGTVEMGGQVLTLDAQAAARLGDEVEPGRYACLEIRDSGRGMDERTLERAREPFFTTHGVSHGGGLGLPAVEGIVKAHGGFLELRSQPGRGTTARLYLPAEDRCAPA